MNVEGHPNFSSAAWKSSKAEVEFPVVDPLQSFFPWSQLVSWLLPQIKFPKGDIAARFEEIQRVLEREALS